MQLLRMELAYVSLPHQHTLLTREECQRHLIATLFIIFCLFVRIADHSVSELSRCMQTPSHTYFCPNVLTVLGPFSSCVMQH